MWKTCLSLLSLYGLTACNDHPLSRIDQALQSASGQSITVRAKTKIDILFVIDESTSMMAEQTSLAQNFSTFSDFIFLDLKNEVDYRIAVTSTGSSDSSIIYADQLGEFVTKGTTSNQIADLSCPETLSPIISPATLHDAERCAPDDDACLQEALRVHFSCLAQVGVDGLNYERGLEAMRSSLSCNGPNGELFGKCCLPSAGGQGFEFDPLCRGGGDEPSFLRPEAMLMVVFITDEDDCSTYASAGIDAPLATCHADPLVMQELTASGDPEGVRQAHELISSNYDHPELCPAGAAECHQRECVGPAGSVLDPVDCYYDRCALNLPRGLSGRAYGNACKWQASKLAPVSYYVDFLNRLKSRPAEQILVANIASPGLLTQSGDRLTFSQEESPLKDVCISDPNTGSRDPDMCCPGGVCRAINDFNACAADSDQQANSSWRYIDFMSMFGDRGLGCREGQGDDCINICEPNLTEALSQLRAQVINAVGDYCVARRPACLVQDAFTGETRPCDEDEAALPQNYQLRVKRICDVDPLSGGACDQVGSTEYLRLSWDELADYELDLNDPTCQSGLRVRLTEPPPAGSRTEIEVLQPAVSFAD